MATLLIVSTQPGAGKTAFAAWLASRLAEAGTKTALLKAFSSVVEGETDPDAAAFESLVAAASTAPPSPASAGADSVARTIAELAGDAAIVEGLSGEHERNRALAGELDARVVLVAGLHDAIVEAAQPYGDRLVGVVINNLSRYREYALRDDVLPQLESAGVRFLGAVPEDRRLVAVTLDTICRRLGGRYSQLPENGGSLVDYILIGGNVLDWGVHYFSSRQNAAVLVRGDRPDIQMAALATPIKGLILTSDVDPLEYVYYEAQQEDVPVVVVPGDTHAAAASLEAVQREARFDHPGKLARFRELADERVDFEALAQALAQPVTG